MNPERVQKVVRVIGLLLLAGLLLFLLARKPEGISVAVNGDHLTLSYTSGDAVTIHYQDVLAVEEIANLDTGRKVTGSETSRFKCGVWENKEFGRYHLCIYSSVPRAILVTASTERYVFNFDSEDATDSFYTAFLPMLQKQQAVAAP